MNKKKFLILLIIVISIGFLFYQQFLSAQEATKSFEDFGIRVNMPKNDLLRIYPWSSARTYRINNDEEWITFDYNLRDYVTFHIKEHQLIDWNVNDRKEVVKEYLSEFCAQDFIHSFPKIYSGITSALVKVPHDVFLSVTDRSRPVLFTGYYTVGTARFANTSEIRVADNDVPAMQKGFTLVKLSTDLEDGIVDAIAGVVMHELAHRYLEHAMLDKLTCAQEREANHLIQSWGADEQYQQAKKYFGRKDHSESKSCQE